jgi:hypothetical protein
MNIIPRIASCAVIVGLLCGCSAAESEPGAEEPGEASQELATCSIYLLDGIWVGPLPPLPLTVAPGICVTLPAASNNRTSSFRTTCPVTFYDNPGCAGPSFAAPTSAVMPAFFNNRATSLIF